MTQKKLVLDAINDLPDEVSLEEIAERVEFLAAIQRGVDQLDRGESIPHAEVKQELADYIAQRAARGNREEFLRVLAKVPPAEPEEWDRLPQ